MKKLLLGSVVLIAISGCATRIGDFTVASNKNFNLNEAHWVDHSKKVVGVDTTHIILIFPLGTSQIEEALDDALDQVPGAVGISDAKVVNSGWWFPFIYGRDHITVEGNPIYVGERPK